MNTVGAPALSSRNFAEDDFVKVVEFLDKGVQIALEAQKATGQEFWESLFGASHVHVLYLSLLYGMLCDCYCMGGWGIVWSSMVWGIVWGNYECHVIYGAGIDISMGTTSKIPFQGF